MAIYTRQTCLLVTQHQVTYWLPVEIINELGASRLIYICNLVWQCQAGITHSYLSQWKKTMDESKKQCAMLWNRSASIYKVPSVTSGHCIETQTCQHCSTHIISDMYTGAQWQLPDVSTHCSACFRCDGLLTSRRVLYCDACYTELRNKGLHYSPTLQDRMTGLSVCPLSLPAHLPDWLSFHQPPSKWILLRPLLFAVWLLHGLWCGIVVIYSTPAVRHPNWDAFQQSCSERLIWWREKEKGRGE